jgi:predicted dinucleotide-binding enzyme
VTARRRITQRKEAREMKVGIVGAGRIGGGIARQFAGVGHEVLLSFSRDLRSLELLAAEIGPSTATGSPAEAVGFGEVVVISVPWSTWPQALEQMGSLAGKIVIDTTNQFGRNTNHPRRRGTRRNTAVFRAANSAKLVAGRPSRVG